MLSIPDTPREDFLHRFSLFSFFCWEIWKTRCDFVFKGTNPDPRLVNIKRANDSYREFWEANTCFSRLSGSRTSPSSPYVGRDRWLPPHANAIKVIFDGAWSPSTSHGGIGVIARDDCGTWRGGTASPIFCNSALVAEAAAALYAVSYAITRDFSKVLFESDCKVFVDSILGNHGNRISMRCGGSGCQDQQIVPLTSPSPSSTSAAGVSSETHKAEASIQPKNSNKVLPN
ncbi:hypothetical protein L3X38_044737 [Prunus dulcis]|uniref:RNase H type-1 domain-containing protein n=1 Tax=Prunus dulcis TaxID=3755 RepID=A0AAD4YND9_PRUDU|nr:hypothetical protein L3X38_044737 [Prunus dulcis]